MKVYKHWQDYPTFVSKARKAGFTGFGSIKK